MDAIGDLLQQRRQQLGRQQDQLTKLRGYLTDHHPGQIEIVATDDQLGLLTADPALASQLQLDWDNLVRYCQGEDQELVIRVKPAGG